MRSMLWLSLSLVACGGKVSEPLTDAVADAPPDVAIPDTGVALTPACSGAGGKLCTEYRWTMCPAGFEPIGTGDSKYGCGKFDGWCCVVAPPSTCSAGAGNCIPGSSCTGCWASVAGATCESGRSCCIDMCD